ncbi:hypothetical protein ACFY3U_03850 [Micromonospora sp. NPDC000089]|uniref:hypothetical protein n=1 Tax=unclassified Micromonospora TaxID=2617518 RepID=UPI00369DE0FF
MGIIMVTREGIGRDDAPAWAAIGTSLVSLGVAIHSAASSRTAARAAQTSAQAGVRQAAAAEEQVAIARRALELTEHQAHTTGISTEVDRIQEALSQEAPYVAWWIDHRSKSTYVLRNIGTGTARDLTIDQTRIECVVRGTTEAAEVAPEASIEIILIPMWGAPKPNELWVRWDGYPDWKAVRLP